MIKIKNISKIYKMGEEEIRALDKVTIKIEKGEFVSIIGPSGSREIYINEYIGSIGCARCWRILLRQH